MDKQIIFANPIKTWSDVQQKWIWYIQYACTNMNCARIDTNIIQADTEVEVRDKAQEVIKAYMENEDE